MLRSLFFTFLVLCPAIIQNHLNYLPEPKYSHKIEYSENGTITLNDNIISVKFNNIEIEENAKWEIKEDKENNKTILTYTNKDNIICSIILDLSNYYFPIIKTKIENNNEKFPILIDLSIETKAKGEFLSDTGKFKIKKKQIQSISHIEWIAKKHKNEIITIKTPKGKVELEDNQIKIQYKNNNFSEGTELHVSNLNYFSIKDQTIFKFLEKSLDFSILSSFNKQSLLIVNISNKYTKNTLISLSLLVFSYLILVWPNVYRSILSSQRMQKAQPEIDAVSEAFKDSMILKLQETNKIYERYNISIWNQIIGQIMLFIPFYMIKNLAISLNFLNLLNPKYNPIIIITLIISLISYYSIFLEKKTIIFSTIMSVVVYLYYYNFLNIFLLTIMNFELTGLYFYETFKENYKTLKIE